MKNKCKPRTKPFWKFPFSIQISRCLILRRNKTGLTMLCNLIKYIAVWDNLKGEAMTLRLGNVIDLSVKINALDSTSPCKGVIKTRSYIPTYIHVNRQMISSSPLSRHRVFAWNDSDHFHAFKAVSQLFSTILYYFWFIESMCHGRIDGQLNLLI